VEQNKALLAENVVFHSPVLVKVVEGRDAVAAIFVTSASVREGRYVLEHKLDERTTFPWWKGTINGQAHSHRAGCGHDSVPPGDHRDDVVAGGVLADIWRGRNPRAASARLSRLDRDGHSPTRRPLPKQDGVPTT
jgi:hypothetical protein